MAQENFISPPLRKPIQEYLTPDPSVGYFTELIDRTDPAYRTPVRGMPYASIRDAKQWVVSAFPSLVFLKESRWRESDQFVTWTFGTDPAAEDAYNAEVTYSGESASCPIYARIYTVRREAYDAAPSATVGTPLKTIISLKVTAQGGGYTEATVTASNGAAITPVISQGKVVSLVLTAQGSDVTSAPTITITGDGSGATATASIQAQSAVLVSQKKVEFPEGHPMRNEYVQSVRVFETLPGPDLTGQEYDPTLGLSVPYTEKRVGTYPVNLPGADITPVSASVWKQHVVELTDAQAALTAIHLQFPTQERVQLPDKLLSAKAYFSRAMGDGQGIGYGTNWSYETSTSASVSGELSVEIEKGYSGVLPAVIHIFFLPVENATTQSITSFVGASMWPAIKEKTHSVVLTGSSLTKHWSASCSSNGGSNSDSCDAKGVVSVSHIPPTIHGNIPIEIEYVDTNLPRSGLDAVTDAWKTQMHQVATKVPAGPARDYLTATLNFMDDLSRPAGSVNPSTLEASSVTSFPEGKFILTSDVSLYKYGMVKVTAVVVDTTGYV